MKRLSLVGGESETKSGKERKIEKKEILLKLLESKSRATRSIIFTFPSKLINLLNAHYGTAILDFLNIKGHQIQQTYK
jgi:hypothetical protein